MLIVQDINYTLFESKGILLYKDSLAVSIWSTQGILLTNSEQPYAMLNSTSKYKIQIQIVIHLQHVAYQMIKQFTED